jgi:hypothetical protein
LKSTLDCKQSNVDSRLEERRPLSRKTNVDILTGSPRGERETTAAKGTYFSFGRKEGADTTFGGTEASDSAGVGLVGLAFAFFEGGSIKPLSLQANGSLC